VVSFTMGNHTPTADLMGRRARNGPPILESMAETYSELHDPYGLPEGGGFAASETLV
jgi:hypothetical protein